MPGFIPLDNTANERPQWREYWPMRKWAQENEFEEDTYYGFFSPKFHKKTRLSPQQVFDYIHNVRSDIVSFSPYLDQSPVFTNIFEQGELEHKGLQNMAQSFLEDAGIPIDIKGFFNDHSGFIYCNFFVAKKEFWELWHRFANRLYQQTDQFETEIGKAFNTTAPYNSGEHIAYKVFMIERLASLLINLYGRFTVRCYPPTELPLGNSPLSKYRQELVVLNALKIAFIQTREAAYFDAIVNLRTKLADLCSLDAKRL